MHESDETLVERARAGNREALEALIARHQGPVYRFGMKMCRDPEDAKEVLQETLLALARNLRTFRGAASLSTWLYAVARRFCLKKRRRERPRADGSDEPVVPLETADLALAARPPDELLASKQVERALTLAIGALAPMYREVLILRDAEGLTAPEVAGVLGINVSAVKSRLHRARLDVRARLGPLLGVIPAAPTATSSCPDVLTSFSRHLEHDIDAQACAAMQQHVDSCEHCRHACESLRRTLVLCSNTGASLEVPRAVQSSVRRAVREFLAQQH